MKRLCIFALFFFISAVMLPQMPIHKQFSALSRPEKCWELIHPFIAKHAFHVTKYVIADVDSLKQEGTLGTDLNGGRLDAFKHAYWMASLSLAIGGRKALKLGWAHEKGNYLQYKKQEQKRTSKCGIFTNSFTRKRQSCRQNTSKKGKRLTAFTMLL